MSKRQTPSEASPLTPLLPWRFEADSGEILGENDWPLVAMVLTAGVPEHIRTALGNFIVRACNSHAALTEENARLRAALEEWKDPLDKVVIGDSRDAALSPVSP